MSTQNQERQQQQLVERLMNEINDGYEECSMSLTFDEDECLGLDWLEKTLKRIAQKGEEHPSFRRAVGVVSAIGKIGEYRAFSYRALHDAQRLIMGMENEIERLRAELRIASGGELN